MALNKQFVLPPPPNPDEDINGYSWRDWFRQLRDYIVNKGTILWSQIDFTGSNITDILTRRHNDLQVIQGGASNQYYHLTSPEYTGTGSGVFVRKTNPTLESPNVDNIDFGTSAVYTNQTGRVGWNSTDATLNIGMEYGVVQQVGEETYARVQNNTGVDIPNGTVVGFAGATSDALLIAPYLADGSSPSLYILGIMTHTLPDSGEKGYCTTWGFVRDLDTSAFSAGDVLYASPSVAGGLTNVKPTAPNNVIPVAACITSNATTGVIFVRPTIQQMQYYGVFSKTTDQSPAVINTEYLLTFDSTQISNGVTIGATTSRIIVPQSGLYQFTATIQLSSSSSSSKNVWVWFKKNGVVVANSARIVTTDINNGYIPITLSETISLTANQYVEIAFAADSTAVTVDSVASTAFAPAAPAIVLEVTQIQQ